MSGAASNLEEVAKAGDHIHKMLLAHIKNTGEPLEQDDAALVAEWASVIRRALVAPVQVSS